MTNLTTTVLFKCPSCSMTARTDVLLSLDRWLEHLPEPKVLLVCDSCLATFKGLAEYRGSQCVISLAQHLETEVLSSRPESRIQHSPLPEGAQSQASTSDFMFEFLSSYRHMIEVLHTYGIGSKGALISSAPEINKLALTGLVSAMEAYLSSMILLLVSEEPDAAKNLLLQEKTLANEKISLLEAWRDSGTVEGRIQDYLHRQLYHNLGKVKELYGIAFKINIFPSRDLEARLHQIMDLRHDIAHRNGKSTDGKDQDISTRRIHEMLNDVHDFICHIQAQLFKDVQDAPSYKSVVVDFSTMIQRHHP